jgi:hypothetical protein
MWPARENPATSAFCGLNEKPEHAPKENTQHPIISKNQQTCLELGNYE